MAYGSRAGSNPQTRRTVRTMLIRRRRPGMALKKKYARTRKDVNKRLTNLRTAVKKLQSRTYGELQLNDQAFYHIGDLVHTGLTPHIYDLCSEQPLMWCAQAISNHSAVWQLRYSPSAAAGARFNVMQIGSFDHQNFALQQLNADPTPNNDLKYRTTQFWQNSLGVQSKYLLKDSYYEFDISCAGISGYVELCAVAHNKNWPIAKATNYSLPDGLKSYINTCKGSLDTNVVSGQTCTVRVLKRMYFQYVKEDIHAPIGPVTNPPVPPPGGLPDIYPSNYFGPARKIFKVHLKQNNVIAVAVDNQALGPGGAQVIDWTEIPLEQQTWLMLRTSVNSRQIQTAINDGDPPSGALNPPGMDFNKRFAVQMRRVTKWRDYLGNSLS